MPKKTLYIARHAKSSWNDMTLSDFERPLNTRGERDAPFMASLLKEKGIAPQLILASPAVRAKATANYYHKTLGGELYFKDAIYESTAMSLFYLIDEAFEKYDEVMLVGHNPGLSELNEILSDKSIYNIPTCGVVGIAFASKSDFNAHQGRELFFEYPKKYQ